MPGNKFQAGINLVYKSEKNAALHEQKIIVCDSNIHVEVRRFDSRMK
jgi:hypothetical protein